MVARLLLPVALAAAGLLALGGSDGHAGACPCIPYLPGLMIGGAALTASPSLGALNTDAAGRVVAAGYLTGDGPTKLAVFRYRNDGSVDSTFGIGGLSLTPAVVEFTPTVAAYGDGRIAVAGSTKASSFAVTRLTADGAVDTTFGDSGTATTQLGTGDVVEAAEPLSDGGLVIAGRASTSGGFSAIALLKYRADGTLDPSFGNAGIVFAPLPRVGGNAFGQILAETFDHHGRILISGYVPVPVPGDDVNAATASFVARYLPDGTPDSSFGPNGMLIDKADPPASDVAVLADDTIVTVGELESNNTDSLVLKRYAEDGTAEPSSTLGSFPSGFDQPMLAAFADGSVAVTVDNGTVNNLPVDALFRIRADGTRESVTPAARVRLLVGLPDGSVAALAWDGALYHYRANGTLDPGFFAAPPSEPSAANALAVRADGAVVTAGWAERGGRRVIELARFQPGTLDPAFGNGGIADTPVGTGDAEASALVLLPDGRLLVAGRAGGRSALLRYLPTGALDLTFGTGGMVLGPSGPSRAVAVQPDGAILVAGGGFSVTRYSPDGRLEATFTPIGTDAVANALTVQPDGRILVAGSRSGRSVLVRLLADGSLDPTFAIVTGPPGTAAALALEPDGRIVTAGTGFAIERYNADGTVDPSFGVAGVATPPVQGDAHAIAVQPNGKIVVGGSNYLTTRVDSFGYLDETWGENYQGHGVSMALRPGGDITALALASDRIVAAGDSGASSTSVTWYIEEGDLAQTDGPRLFAVRGMETRTLTKTGARSPALSPDRKSIAFVSIASGQPELYVVPVTGGKPVKLTSSPFGKDAVAVGHVAWSPDGTSIAFDANGHVSDPRCTHACLTSDVYAVSPDGTHLRRLVAGGSGASWSADGKYLAYDGPIAADGTTNIVIAAAEGSSPHTIAVGATPSWAPSAPLWSPRADMLAYQTVTDNLPGFVVRRVDGKLVNEFSDYQSPAWSPDGRKLVALTNYAGKVDVLPLHGGDARVLLGGYALRGLSWSPTGRQIALYGTVHNEWYLIVRDARTGHLVRRVGAVRADAPPSWSAKGSTIYVGG